MRRVFHRDALPLDGAGCGVVSGRSADSAWPRRALSGGRSHRQQGEYFSGWRSPWSSSLRAAWAALRKQWPGSIRDVPRYIVAECCDPHLGSTVDPSRLVAHGDGWAGTNSWCCWPGAWGFPTRWPCGLLLPLAGGCTWADAGQSAALRGCLRLPIEAMANRCWGLSIDLCLPELGAVPPKFDDGEFGQIVQGG